MVKCLLRVLKLLQAGSWIAIRGLMNFVWQPRTMVHLGPIHWKCGISDLAT